MRDVALIFPGQGAQFVGMGRELYEESPAAGRVFDEACEVLGMDVKTVVFEGPEERLTSTACCQPAILTMSLAALAALRETEVFQGLRVRFTAGLSLGEYAALAAAEAFDAPEALRLVARRAALMDEAARTTEGGMAAVIGLDAETIAEVCERFGIQVANYNSPQQTVISGERRRIIEASRALTEAGAKSVVPLEVSGAFHSRLMAPAAERFAAVLAETAIRPARIPVVSNVDARPHTDPEEIRGNLAGQITSSVRWVETVRFISGQGVSEFLEVGPGQVLKGLLRRIDRSLRVQTVGSPKDIASLSFPSPGRP